MGETKEWTLMFYFASDNPLAPGIVSQLKALKQAGFHPEANVVAQFDPQTEGTPTHIFDVNLINKLKNHGAPNIGFDGNDPFVRNLLEDKLWRDQKARDGKSLIRDQIKTSLGQQNIPYNPPVPPSGRSARKGATPGKEPDPKTSLENFLKFCADRYPARHYMLFILGHGVVVGNDIFLFDEHAERSSLSLTELGEVLSAFKQDVTHQDAAFEFVSFHSCSVSSLEVAYELQGTANYMLASQGPAFVGSWPYRQILIRVFNDLVRYGAKIDVKEMLTKIFYYCLYNSSDFLLAGYSFDLCLCNLNLVSGIKEPLKKLSKALVDGFSDRAAKDFIKDSILLSHWEAQSYWQESYTDLYDFCFCLSRRCRSYVKEGEKLPGGLQAIDEACGLVMDELVKEKVKSQAAEKTGKDYEFIEKTIVRAEFVGPAYQYSHGLSIFFPWSAPSEDSQVLVEYRQYKLNEVKPTESSWLNFLEAYFEQTMRNPSKDEPDERQTAMGEPTAMDELLEDIASLVYNEEGQLSNENSLGDGGIKVNPPDPTGDECTCPSIKNYPRDTRARRKRGRQAPKEKKSIPISQTFLDQFKRGA